MSNPQSSSAEGISRRTFLAAATTVPLLAATRPGGNLRAAEFVQHGQRTGGHIALTFNGAGDPQLTRQILSLTARIHSPITVFAVGTWAAANPALIKGLVSGGHELANHTFTHPALRRLARPGVRAEIVGCADTLRAATGHIGAWFRPSGTPTPTKLMLEESVKAGYPTVVGYDVDPLDYQDPGTKLVVTRTLAAIRGGSIVSLHLGHQGTVDAIQQIVTRARRQGLEPVTVSTLLHH